MSGRKSKKNQRLGSSRRGPKGLNRNIEKDDDDDGSQQSEDGRDEFHTTSYYHATQFDHPPSSSIEQQTSALECPPHARGHKDSLMETEMPEMKRKMGSTRKSTGRFKGERNLDDVRTTEELDEEYVTQPSTSTTEEHHASLTEEEQSSFPSDLSLQTKSYGFGKESGTTLVFAVSENKEKDRIHHQEITPHSHEVVSDVPIDEAMGPSVNSIAVKVAEREDSVMLNEPKTLSHQETQIASTSGQKRRMGSTRRPLGGKNGENVGVQEHSRNMTENESKAEVMGEAKLKMSEEMAQTWDDVARDDPLSHTESALLLSQSLLADRAELKEPDVSAGTETMNQSVGFPLVDSEKPLPETFSHHGTPLLNEALDFEFGSHTEDLDVLNKVLKEAGSHLSDNSQHVSDTRKDTNPSYDFRDINTEAKKVVLKQKEEPQLEELALHDQESLLSQHDIATLDNNYDCSMVQHIVVGCTSFGMPVSNISHAEPTTTNLPHEMRDAVEERQEIHIEMKQENNFCNVASVTCDTPTDLVSIMEEDEDPHILATRENENMSNERGSETEYAFEMTDQSDVSDHNVTQIIMDVRDNEKDGETSTETICISHQKPCDVSTENKELYKGQEHYSSNISLTHSPTQDDAGKMLENEEVRKDKKETENTAVNDVTSKSEEMFSSEDSATDRGSHAHQQLFMQSPDKEGYDLHENVTEKSEKEELLFSVESENAAFDRGNERSEGTDGVKEMDAAPVLTLDLHLEIEARNKTFDSTNSEADGTEENINGASVLVRENKVIGNTVEHNMTTESDFLQSSPGAHMEALKISKNAEKEVSGETNTIPEQSDISIIPADSHSEETHSKSSPVIHKRKMGSTRRPLKGNTGRRKDHNEKEIFNLEDEPSPDESRYTAVSICDISESQTITKMYAESQENAGDVKIVPAEGDTESHSENKTIYSPAFEGEVEFIGDTLGSNMTTESDFHQTSDANMETLKVSENSDSDVSSDPIRNSQSEIQPENKMIELTSEAERTEDTICEASVSVRQDEFTVDTVTVDSNMTIESDLLQSDTLNEANLEALKVSKNTESVSAVTDSDLLVQDDVTEGSRQTDTFPEQSDIDVIPEYSRGEEARSKSSPIVHKRKMGSTRRPLKGKNGQRKEIEHHDENETLDSDSVINAEKQTFSLENEPSPDESTLQRLKDGAKEQEMEICEKNDVGPVEGSESALLQSSCSSDLVSEESTAISICHITESQTLTNSNVESQENTGDVERVAAEEDKDLQLEIDSQNKTFDSTTREAEETEKNIQDVSVTLIREVDVTGDTVTVESIMTTESDFLQTSPDAHMEALKISKNAEKEVSGETNTIPEQSNISIIPADSHSEETHSKSSPVIHKRKMGSTRRPLKGNTGRRKDHNEKEIFNLEDEPSPDESRYTAVSICDISESQTITKMYAGSQENAGDVKIVPAEGDTESHSENKTIYLPAFEGEVEVIGDTVGSNMTTESDFHQTSDANMETLKVSENSDSDVSSDPIRNSQSEIQPENKMIELTSEAERTEDTICEASVSVRQDEFTVDTVTVDSNMTIESDLLQSDTLNEANLEALKVSKNTESVSAVTDSDLLVQDDVTEGSRQTDTFPEQSDIDVIPEYSRGEEARSKSSPIVHKRKMGSTRRPLKGKNGQRKEIEHHDENETLDSDSVINAEKQTFSLENEPSPDESTLQRLKDGAKEQEMEICEKNDVGPVEGSESALLQSSCSSDLVSEESTAISICHITESQTLTNSNVESQENTGDAERVAAEEDKDLQLEIDSQNKTFDSTTREAEETEKNIQDVSVTLIREVDVTGDTVTVESIMTTESDFLQTSPDAHMEALKISKNTESVSAVTDSDLLVQDDVTEGSRQTDTFPEQSDIDVIPEYSRGEEVRSKSSPIVHKRKMGSTRRPLRGKNGQRKEIEHHDENETLASDSVINAEKQTFSLENEPSPDESTLQRLKDGAKEQEKEIHEKNDADPVEGSESALLQSSCSSDLVSEESTAISICHITESQTLTNSNVESQENTGDAERVAAEEDKDLQLEIDSQNKTFDSTTREAEETEKNIQDVSVTLITEVDVTGDTVTVESIMTTESDFLQTSPDAHMEALKISKNAEKEVSGETNTIPEQSDISIIPADSHSEETHSKSSPVIHKRKMGSTRRPLKGIQDEEKIIMKRNLQFGG
ncbi:uncharacterized protein LOC131543061 [Onychostoma macrolepis]|uniref:uncharacterized protein LOC131543061 n=1 Tax=Onychostoma macrolepis TaxID=369639 RepID=UPI00272D9039|nr:uncharacterized protein LOC131543061 [Onychostoma macrolepis]